MIEAKEGEVRGKRHEEQISEGYSLREGKRGVLNP